MAVPTSSQVLSLYRRMLKESKKFTTYNYRTFALRRVKDAFRENKNVTNPEVIQQLIETANANLEIIRRQVTYTMFKVFSTTTDPVLPQRIQNVLIGHLYTTQKLIIENQ